MSKFKNFVARKPKSSHPLPPAAETTTSTMVSIMVATTAPSLDRTCKGWRLPCLFCAQSTPYPSPVDSDWLEEDSDGDIERQKRKGKTKKGRGSEAKTEIRRTRENIKLLSSKPNIWSNHEEETLPHLTSQQKIKIDPNDYPQTISLK